MQVVKFGILWLPLNVYPGTLLSMDVSNTNEALSDPQPVAVERVSDWTPEDAEWEQRQETAIKSLLSGDIESAGDAWHQALDLAREFFPGNDPRLATSIANHAVYLASKGDVEAAKTACHDALQIWESAATWIDGLKITQQARSSTFHLRMEMKHREAYENAQRKQLRQLGAEGRMMTARLAGSLSGNVSGYNHTLPHWMTGKSSERNDKRKLMAAVFLLVECAN